MKKKLNQLDKYTSCPSWPIFWFSGFVTGFLALLISTISGFFVDGELNLYPEKKQVILLLVFIEEVIKLGVINFICSNKPKIDTANIFNGLFFGFGFAVFELFLLFANFGKLSIQSTPVIALISIHSIISVFMIISVCFLKNKKYFWFLITFLLAFIVHATYNLVIHIYIY